jgi:hypothetical protein
MNILDFEREYRGARRFTTFCFAMMMVVVMGSFVLNNWGDVTDFAVEAYEQPTKVFSSAIRGMAVKE